MAEQERRTKHAAPSDHARASERSPEITKKGEALKKDLDAVLDEIDHVLEDNAEEFVKSYVQRGGE